MIPDIDVIVIGSGPAGYAAAINCNQAGLSVLMITKTVIEAEPEIRAPAQSVHPGIESLLHHIGGIAVLKKATVGRYAGIKSGINIHDFSVITKEKAAGYHIDKTIFTNGLKALAVSKGVIIAESETVTGFIRAEHAIIGVELASAKKITAKYTIDASGYKKAAAAILNIKQIFYSPPLICWTGRLMNVPPGDKYNFLYPAEFIAKPDGWIWIARESAEDCTFTSLSRKGAQLFKIPEELKDAGRVQHLLKANMRWGVLNSVAFNGLIICGDAAGVIDPAAGQGILNAIYSGIKASETIATILLQQRNEGEALAEYQAWLLSAFTTKVNMLRDYYENNGISVF